MSTLVGSALSVGPPPASIGPEERHLLCSLIESAQFGPGVKACFDRQWVTPAGAASGAAPGSSEGPWRAILAESVGAKQAQIRQICQEHYGEFLAGIEHLLSVKVDLNELRELAQSLNSSVQTSGRAVLQAAKALNEQRRIRYQINSAQQILQSCASLLALARKAKIQIRGCKYFSALKTLHQLQRILHVAVTNAHKANQQALAAAAAAAGSAANGGGANGSALVGPALISPTSAAAAATKSGLAGSSAAGGSSASSQAAAAAELTSARFDFLHQLERQIPLLTGQIKESVRAEFTNWLSGIARRSQQIGELALSQIDDSLTLGEKKRSAARKKLQARRLVMLQRKAASGGGGASDKRRKGSTQADDDDEDEYEDDNDGLDALSGGGPGSGGANAASLFDTFPINFTSVYQCLHIYEHLSQSDVFQALYKERRQAQLMDAVHGLSVLGAIGGGAASPRAQPLAGGMASPKAAPVVASTFVGGAESRGRSGAAALSTSTPTSSAASTSPPALSPRPGASSSATTASPASPISPSSPSSASPDVIETYTTVLASITGFFLVEDSILKSGNELMSRAEVDALYEKVQLLLMAYLSAHLASHPFLQSVPHVLQLKYVLVLLLRAMDESSGSGFVSMGSSPLLHTFLCDQRNRIESLLLRKLASDTRLLFAREKWEPLGVETPQEHRLFVLDFGLGDARSHVDFPVTMPFSVSVPLLSRALQNFIEDYFAWGKYLDEAGGSGSAEGASGSSGRGASSTGGASSSGGGSTVSLSWKAHVLRAVDRALSNEVNGAFLDLLGEGPSSSRGGGHGQGQHQSASALPISQTVQFSINAQVLSELTCPFLERFIALYGTEDEGLASELPLDSSSPLGSPMSGPLSPSNAAAANASGRLSARGLLFRTKLHCEDLLFELIGAKLDAFLSLDESFDWLPNDVNDQPSDHVLDAVTWLETTLSCMSFMPDAVREAAHFTSCKHLADALLSPLTDANHPRCKKFNVYAVANLARDVRVLEDFAARCHIANLVETFSELRQLVDLLLSGDVEILLDPPARQERFGHLSSAKLVRVLDKFKDLSLFSMTSTPQQYKKLKKKNVEAVVKKLRAAMQ